MAPTRHSTSRSNEATDNLQELRVLVVEDEALIAEEIKDRLQQMGAIVVGIADTASKALELAEEHRPQIVLMDIRLKGDRDGIDAATEIYQRFDIPAVFLTAYSDRATLNRVIAIGQFGYLTKPFREKDLATTIQLGIYHHRIEAGLRTAQLSLKGVIENAAEALMAVDAAGRVRYHNKSAEEITGIGAMDALDQRVDAVLRLKNELSREFVSGMIDKVLSGEELTVRDSPFLLVRSDGTELPIELSIAPVNDGEGIIGAAVTFSNVSKRRRMQRQIDDQRTLIGSLIDGIPEMFFAIDSGKCVRFVNHALLDTFNMKRDDVIGKPLADIWVDDSLTEIDRQAELAIRTKHRVTFQQRAWRDDNGDVRWFVFSYMPIASSDDVVLICTARDITERKALEEEFIDATAREHQRLGQDLHDGLGQELTSVALLLKNLEHEFSKHLPQYLPHLGEIGDAVSRSIAAMRSAARGLTPTDLETGGLAMALQQLAARCSRSYDIPCTFSGNDSKLPQLDTVVATNLFRIAQEAISNAARHAHGTQIATELVQASGQLILSVTDDGVGLGGNRVEAASGMGLKIMEYRAQKVGGTLRLEEPDRGTRIVVRIPLSLLGPAPDRTITPDQLAGEPG